MRRGGKAFMETGRNFVYDDIKKHATYYGGQGKIAENMSQCRKEEEEAR